MYDLYYIVTSSIIQLLFLQDISIYRNHYLYNLLSRNVKSSRRINFVFVLEVRLSESCTCSSHLRGPVGAPQPPLLSLRTSGEWCCISDPDPARTHVCYLTAPQLKGPAMTWSVLHTRENIFSKYFTMKHTVNSSKILYTLNAARFIL